MQVRVFSSGGVRIAYIDEGEGSPILLIHGFVSNAKTNWVDPGWVSVLKRNGFRVIALDNRGHGQSEKLYDPAQYALPLMAQDARGLLDHLGIDRADVMGYSMGARITTVLAHRHPTRVRSAVFGGMGSNMVRPLMGTDAIAAALEAPSIDQVTDANARTFRAFADKTGGDRKALSACVRGSHEPIPREVPASLACPVLIAVGTEDVIAGSPEELAAIIPGAEVLAIPRRDHMLAVGDRVYKDGVLAFLQRRP